jgi:hypothetical protein
MYNKQQKGAFVFPVTFTNSGNQCAVISEVTMSFQGKKTSTGIFVSKFIPWCIEPITLKPGEILTTTILFKYGDDEGESFFKEIDYIEVMQDADISKISTRIQFTIIDSLGKEHNVDYEGI